MDPNLIQQLLQQNGQTANQQAGSFSQMLKDRSNFVNQTQGQSFNQAQNTIQNGGNNGVRISSADALAPSFQYAGQNMGKTEELNQMLLGLLNASTEAYKSAGDVQNQQANQALQNKQLNLQYGYGDNGDMNVQGLLKRRADYQAQGISTAGIDAQLRANGVEPGGDKALELPKQVVDLIDEIKGRDTARNTGIIGGIIPFLNTLPYGKTTQAKIDQLKSILSLQARQLIKGTGSISDAETKMLSNSVAALQNGMSDKDFRAELEKIRGIVIRNSGLPDAGSSAKIVEPGSQVGNFKIEEVK